MVTDSAAIKQTGLGGQLLQWFKTCNPYFADAGSGSYYYCAQRCRAPEVLMRRQKSMEMRKFIFLALLRVLFQRRIRN